MRLKRLFLENLSGLVLCIFAVVVLGSSAAAGSADISPTIARVKPSIVGVGTFQASRNPKVRFRGTGFVVGDGTHILTNGHVIPPFLDVDNRESLIVMVGRGTNYELREAERAAQDLEHDLAVLKIKGSPLPALTIGDSRAIREGATLLFTGFPIGTVLGLFPVTHRAMVSCITPIVIPQTTSRQLDPRVLNRLRNPFEVFQLDGTAYPGNSGSPLYDPDTGAVVGVLNMVFVKASKENAIEDPSGISYAIPSAFIIELLNRANVQR
jgi:serine protease Do